MRDIVVPDLINNQSALVTAGFLSKVSDGRGKKHTNIVQYGFFPRSFTFAFE